MVVATTTIDTSLLIQLDSTNEQYDINMDLPAQTTKPRAQTNLHKTYIFIKIRLFHEDLQKMNMEQRLIFTDAMLRKCLYPWKPIHLFLTGRVGMCKTFTLLLIVQGLLHHYVRGMEVSTNCPLALLMAYSGKAAFNIGATTIHLALH